MRHRTIVIAAVAACLVVVLLATPTVIYQSRQHQFAATQQLVQALGGSLRFDLVDGNYLLDLHGPAASEETIQRVVPELKRLPTGFTLIGPGEERSFWVSVSGTQVTDPGVAKLCELELGWFQLDGGRVTDASAVTLAKQPKLHGVILTNVGISDSAIAELRDSIPQRTVIVNVESD